MTFRNIVCCYAALQPDENLVRAYLNKIDQLEEDREITTDEVFMLRHSLEAKQALMDLTSGDEQAFTLGTVKEIIELIRERIQSKIRAEIEVEAQKKVNKVTKQRDKLKTQLEARIQQLGQVQQEIESFTASEIRRKANIKLSARRIAYWISRVCEGIFISILVVGTIFTFPRELPSIGESPIRYSIAIVFLIALIFVIMNLIKGVTIESIVRTIEIKLQKWFENLIIRFTA